MYYAGRRFADIQSRLAYARNELEYCIQVSALLEREMCDAAKRSAEVFARESLQEPKEESRP